jgi:hypothetical protein
MHRSGTSIVTRLLNRLGVSLGPEEELLEPVPHNPAGFWENERVVALNDELLAALGRNATTPPVLLADGWEWSPELDGLRERAAAVVASISTAASVVAMKDPRHPLRAGPGRSRSFARVLASPRASTSRAHSGCATSSAAAAPASSCSCAPGAAPGPARGARAQALAPELRTISTGE